MPRTMFDWFCFVSKGRRKPSKQCHSLDYESCPLLSSCSLLSLGGVTRNSKVVAVLLLRVEIPFLVDPFENVAKELHCLSGL